MEQLPKLLFCIDGVDTSLGNLRTLDWPQKQQQASSMSNNVWESSSLEEAQDSGVNLGGKEGEAG